MKIKITYTLLLLIVFKIGYTQQKVTTEGLFQQFLISQDEAVAKKIIASNDNLYSIFCEAYISKNQDKKIKGFSKFIESAPKYGLAMAYNERGAAYCSKGETIGAMNDFNRSLQLDSANAYTYYLRGAAYMDFKKIDSAIEDINKAIKLNTGFAAAYHLRGIAYDDQKKYENAIADFTTEIKLDKKSDIAYKMRGFVYNEVGKYRFALADWKKAEKLNPDNARLLDGFIDKAIAKMRNE